MRQYTITSIGVNALMSEASSINNHGVVVGSATFQGAPPQAVRYDGSLHILESVLPVLSPGFTGKRMATGINNATPEQIVGRNFVESFDSTRESAAAMLWTNSQPQVLQSLAFKDSSSFITDVNDIGLAVGSLNGSAFRVFVWDTRLFVSFRTPDSLSCIANAVNSNGSVVGTSTRYNLAISVSNFETRGFVYNSGLLDISNQYEIFGTHTVDELNDINDSDQIVGRAGRIGIWSSRDSAKLLHGMNGDLSTALSLNNHADIVGMAVHGKKEQPYAMIWSANDAGQDLNKLLVNGEGWHLLRANGINDHGQIVGNGLYNGVPQGFLLTPLPISVAFNPLEIHREIDAIVIPFILLYTLPDPPPMDMLVERMLDYTKDMGSEARHIALARIGVLKDHLLSLEHELKSRT